MLKLSTWCVADWPKVSLPFPFPLCSLGYRLYTASAAGTLKFSVSQCVIFRCLVLFSWESIASSCFQFAHKLFFSCESYNYMLLTSKKESSFVFDSLVSSGFHYICCLLVPADLRLSSFYLTAQTRGVASL